MKQSHSTHRSYIWLLASCLFFVTSLSHAQTATAPDFSLTDLDGRVHTLNQYKGKVVVLEFFNPQCPFIKRAHTNEAFLNTIKSTQAKGVVWLAINANAPGRQGASAEANMSAKKTYGINFPILMNPMGNVGKAYGATRTPEMVVISADGHIIYRGAVDSSGGSKYSKKAITYWLKDAITAHLAGKPVPTAKTKPWGCSVKY